MAKELFRPLALARALVRVKQQGQVRVPAQVQVQGTARTARRLNRKVL